MKTFQDVFLTYDMTATGLRAHTARLCDQGPRARRAYTDLVPELPASGHQRAHLPINRPGPGDRLQDHADRTFGRHAPARHRARGEPA